MHAFVLRLARRIEQPQPETIADSLLDAGEIMRMWRFFDGDPGGSAVFGPSSEQTQFPHVQADDIERLRQALVTFVERHPQHPQLCSAIHGLYYLAAPDTKNLLLEVLRGAIGRDSNTLYQTILALEALGDNLYGRARAQVVTRLNAMRASPVTIYYRDQVRPKDIKRYQDSSAASVGNFYVNFTL